jgi:hypothetical protein
VPIWIMVVVLISACRWGWCRGGSYLEHVSRRPGSKEEGLEERQATTPNTFSLTRGSNASLAKPKVKPSFLFQCTSIPDL